MSDKNPSRESIRRIGEAVKEKMRQADADAAPIEEETMRAVAQFEHDAELRAAKRIYPYLVESEALKLYRFEERSYENFIVSCSDVLIDEGLVIRIPSDEDEG